MPTATATNPFEVKASSGGGNYDLCPQGSHPGRPIALVDLGTHEDDYKGKVKLSRKVALAFELTAENKPDGTPFVLAKQYTLAFTEGSNLRQMIEAWRGRKFAADEEFNLATLIDKPCLVNVSHRKSGDKTYHEIAGISAVPKGLHVPEKTREPVLYICDPTSPPPSEEWLPYLYGESVADIIERSKEFQGVPIPPTHGSGASGDGQADDSDIPF